MRYLNLSSWASLPSLSHQSVCPFIDTTTDRPTDRELCRNLKPLAPWDNVEPHRSLKHLPALNIDLLANEDPPMRAEALSELVVRGVHECVCMWVAHRG